MKGSCDPGSIILKESLNFNCGNLNEIEIGALDGPKLTFKLRDQIDMESVCRYELSCEEMS